jgi:hypothetical protein
VYGNKNLNYKVDIVPFFASQGARGRVFEPKN